MSKKTTKNYKTPRRPYYEFLRGIVGLAVLGSTIGGIVIGHNYDILASPMDLFLSASSSASPSYLWAIIGGVIGFLGSMLTTGVLSVLIRISEDIKLLLERNLFELSASRNSRAEPLIAELIGGAASK